MKYFVEFQLQRLQLQMTSLSLCMSFELPAKFHVGSRYTQHVAFPGNYNVSISVAAAVQRYREVRWGR